MDVADTFPAIFLLALRQLVGWRMGIFFLPNYSNEYPLRFCVYPPLGACLRVGEKIDHFSPIYWLRLIWIGRKRSRSRANNFGHGWLGNNIEFAFPFERGRNPPETFRLRSRYQFAIVAEGHLAPGVPHFQGQLFHVAEERQMIGREAMA